MYKIIILTFFLFCISLNAKTLNIAVAANVSYAIEELKKEFKKTNPNTKIRVTLGSSGKLTAQIKNGAPYDIFLSANMKYPNFLFKNSLALKKPKIYAKGKLALFSKKPRDFSKGLDLLLQKDIRRVAIANEKTAPYGKAAMEALKNKNILSLVKSKFIYAESISQTLSYAMRATDIGIVAKSTLFSKKLKRFSKNKNWIDIDSKLYTPINQGIVILKKAKDKKEAFEFYDFMLSNNAKKVLKNFGYEVK